MQTQLGKEHITSWEVDLAVMMIVMKMFEDDDGDYGIQSKDDNNDNDDDNSKESKTW